MLRTIAIVGIALAGTIAGSEVSAMSMRQAAEPAETPPMTFTGSQYIDSRGCVYIRAGTALNVTWVPRVTRGGEVICDQTPSGVTAQSVSAPPVPAVSAISPRSRGALSPLTGFAVPKGYKVAWDDGRLNPRRGPGGGLR